MSLSYYVIGKHKEWQKSVAKFMLLRIFGIKKRSSFECRLITLLFIWKKIEIFIITRSKTRRRWRKKEKEEHQRKCICEVSNETSHLVAAKQNTSFFSSCIPSSVSSSHSALFPTFHPHLTPHCFSILYFLHQQCYHSPSSLLLFFFCLYHSAFFTLFFSLSQHLLLLLFFSHYFPPSFLIQS